MKPSNAKNADIKSRHFAHILLLRGLEPVVNNETSPKNAAFPPLFVAPFSALLLRKSRPAGVPPSCGCHLLALWTSRVCRASIGEKAPFLFDISFIDHRFLIQSP